jgi:erythromycin esterase
MAACFVASGGTSTNVRAQSSCDDQASVRELSSVTIQRGTLAPGESTCFHLTLARGELARIVISVERGYVRARVLSPTGDELQRTWTSSFAFAAPSPMLTIEAPSSGAYIIELGVPTWVNFKDAQLFRIHVGSRESARVRAARRNQHQNDPRVAYLRSNARTLRTVDPDASDFTDLEFLHDMLRDTRVVLLGEGDNGGGSDILAKTRLVKFLHDRMGFDVVAFQSSLYSSVAGWEAVRASPGTRAVVEMAMPRLLGGSAQVEPLIQYVAAAARTSRPLELTGFDSQFSASAASAFFPELRAFLRVKLPDSVLLDTAALPSRLLSDVLAGRVGGAASLPTPPEQAEAVGALRTEARRVGALAAGPETVFWAQALRSAAGQLELILDSQRGASANATLASLVRQLAENLIWLAESRYAGRRIIVWSHTFHAVRSPDAISHGRSTGFTVGEALWQALGPEVFAIGLTSYDGTSYFITQPADYYQSVIPDQYPDDGFETLMAAAGHEIAFVNLREARERNVWLGGRFVANALYLVPENAEWSRALDALLFIRTQQPRRRAR